MRLTKYLLTEPLGTKRVLMVNCLSGAVDFLDTKDFRNLKELNFTTVPAKHIEALKARGYLFNNRNEEIQALNSLQNKYAMEPADKIVDFVICLTFDCNLDCAYCFQKQIKKSLYLSRQNVKQLLQAITKMSSLFPGKKTLQLFGGEPLLPKNKSVVSSILDFCHKSEMPVALTTNGTTILQYSKLLADYKELIKVAQITLDGPPEIHDKRRVPKNGTPTFSTIIKGIDYLLKCKIGVQARVNIDKTNINSLPSLALLLKDRGLLDNKLFKCILAPIESHCSENKPKTLLDEKELLEKIETMVRGNPYVNKFSYERIPKILKHLHSVLNNKYSGPSFSYCEANRNGYFVFAPDGLIYPCSEAAGHKELAIGSFFPKYKINNNKLSKWNLRTINKVKKCLECNIAPLCGGGCTFAAYKIKGNISEPYCSESKKVLENYLREKKYALFLEAKKRVA